MRPKWKKHEEAIKRLEDREKKLKLAGESTAVRRYVAEDLMLMNSGVFEYEVRLSSLFRAYSKPEVDGRSSSYEISDLIAHLKRMTDNVELAKLLYYQYCLPEKEFSKEYPHEYSYTFANGTKTPFLGGINERD